LKPQADHLLVDPLILPTVGVHVGFKNKILKFCLPGSLKYADNSVCTVQSEVLWCKAP